MNLSLVNRLRLYQVYVSHIQHVTQVRVKSKLCYDRRSVGQCVLISSPHLRPKTRFLLLSDSCGFVDVGRPLWREDGSVVYNCRWPSSAQSFSGPSPAGLITIFYCLRFETPPTWSTRSPYLYPPGTGWPSYTPTHCVPFSSPPTARGSVVGWGTMLHAGRSRVRVLMRWIFQFT
jgi:hypothetical protein